jgi:hypothetical protein
MNKKKNQNLLTADKDGYTPIKKGPSQGSLSYRRSSGLIGGYFLRFVTYPVILVILILTSCAEMARDMGIDDVTEVQMRSGLTGTQKDPAELDPFKRYDLVMTANECRYFTIKVPSSWFWKVYVTAAARKENSESRVNALIFPSDPAWASLPATTFDKAMVLKQDGDQALLAVGNTGPSRQAVLRICQEGAPANVTLESQVSTTDKLLGPQDDSGISLDAPHVSPLKDN